MILRSFLFSGYSLLSSSASVRAFCFFIGGLFATLTALTPGDLHAQNRCDSLRESLLSAKDTYDSSLSQDYSRAIDDQKRELAAVERDLRQLGCGQNFTGNNACYSTLRLLDSMKENLYRLQYEASRLVGSEPASAQSILTEMRLYGCIVPEDYRDQFNEGQQGVSVSSQNFFIGEARPPNYPLYRTVCVRLSDGYAFPISFATTNDHFLDDEAICHNACPEQRMALFVHDNPQQTLDDAISLDGLYIYGQMAGRKRYELSFDPKLNCALPELDQAQLHPFLRLNVINLDPEESTSKDLPELVDNQKEDRVIYNSLRASSDHVEGRPYDPGSIRLVGPGFFPEDIARKSNNKRGQ